MKQTTKATQRPLSLANISHFLLGLLFYIALDIAWIQLVVYPMYADRLGIQMIQPNQLDWRVGLGTWLIIVLGYRIFAYPRAIASGDLGLIALWGGLYGLVVYGVFTLTNLAVLRCWSTQLAIGDVLSGIGLCTMLSLFMCRGKVRSIRS